MSPPLATYGRWLLLGALTLCLGLVVVQDYASLRAYDQTIQDLERVTDNSMPRLLHLTEVRRTIREAGMDLAASRDEGLEGRLDARWAAIDGHVKEYMALAPLPADVASRAQLVAALQRLRADETRLHRADVDEAQRAALEMAHVADRRAVQRALDAIFVEDTQAAYAAAQDVAQAHARANALSLWLMSATVVALALAGAASWLLLARMESRVDRQLQELDAFAGRVAHDLKGPLHPALLSTALLRDEPLSEPGGAALERLERNLRRAGALVDSLLTFARSGARPQADARSDVAHVLEELRPPLLQLARSEEASLSFDVPPGLEVAAEPSVVSSILENLVRNAVLYLGPASRREVRVRGRAERGRVVVEVADTGAGIPTDLLRRLFRPFERGSDRPGGSGLGLATVKRLVETHGGDVEVRSHVGAGSTFTVRLPQAPSLSPAEPSPPPGASVPLSA